ncbi:MAG: dienelactone hydrolase family protein [Alphaproteobacteria bacterium]|nr:dienelactone hydrolase family protein [Alphaproteobacteria bacterium]
MIEEEIVHVKGHPEKLIIFFHGYIDSPEYVDEKIVPLLEGLDNVAVHIPKSPIPCEIHPKKFQWYSMHRFDDNDDRKTVATMEECVAIYSRMKLGILEAYEMITPYIDNLLSEYGLEDKDLYLCGYSQGATLAIFTALMREEKIAGLLSFSGILAPQEFLIKNHKSSPDVLLIHGTSDNQVRFEALAYTKKNLETCGCKVRTYVVNDGQHRISDEGIHEGYEFIAKRFTRKVAV